MGRKTGESSTLGSPADGGRGWGRKKKPEKRSLGSTKEQKFFLSGSAVGSLPSMQEMQVGPLVGSPFGIFPKEGNGNPLQYSCLGNPMDRGAWWATVHGGHKEWDTTE